MSTAPTPQDLDQNPHYLECKEAVRQCVEDCTAGGLQAVDLSAIDWPKVATQIKTLFQTYGPIVIRILAELGLLSTAEPHFGEGNPGSAKPKG